jgi:hypothetical protein
VVGGHVASPRSPPHLPRSDHHSTFVRLNVRRSPADCIGPQPTVRRPPSPAPMSPRDLERFDRSPGTLYFAPPGPDAPQDSSRSARPPLAPDSEWPPAQSPVTRAASRAIAGVARGGFHPSFLFSQPSRVLPVRPSLSAQRSPSAAGTAQPPTGLDARTRGAVSVRCTALLGCPSPHHPADRQPLTSLGPSRAARAVPNHPFSGRSSLHLPTPPEGAVSRLLLCTCAR